MFQKTYFLTSIIYCNIIWFFLSTPIIACDTTPSLTVDNVIENSDGTYYMDISACIGSGGSADGFDLYFNNDINILGTSVNEVTSPTTGNVAEVSVSNGIWLANFEDFNTDGTYFDPGGFGGDCIEFGVIVDTNPEGATLCSNGINEDCLGFTQDVVFITCGVIPGPCVPNYSLTDSGTINGNVSIAGQNCNFAPFNDEIIELTVTCPGNFNISLTQDDSGGFFGGESWLTLALGCCSGSIEQVTSFFEQTISINNNLDIGTYYIIVDADNNLFSGNYLLEVTSDADPTNVTEANAGDDQQICEDTIMLNGNNPSNIEVGTWSIIAGNGNLIDPSNPNTNVTNLSEGENIFLWEISGECATSTDELTIEVNNDINLNIPDIVYCLDAIPLSASSSGENGEWSVTPELNMNINDINLSNTVATASAYGDYIFSYTSCGNTASQLVSIASSTPIVSSPESTYTCLENFNLLAEIEGDPGYWDFSGPYIANFNNITSLNPTVTVEGYGSYIFTYYGCGTSNSIIINMMNNQPTVSGPEEIYCLQTFELNANVENDPGYWSFEGPGNAEFTNQGNTMTSVSVDEYGLYTFIYNGCGTSSQAINVNSLSATPQIITPNQNTSLDCELQINLEAYVLGDPGFWDFSGPGNASFENQNSQSTTVLVDEYGEYEFTYYGCGTESTPVSINFQTVEPTIIAENKISCQLNTSLSASTEFNQNIEWFISESPSNSEVVISSPTNIDTELDVSDYGTYIIGLNGCGTTSFIDITFEPVQPHIIAPNFQNCILTATLIAYTDDPDGGGPWTQITGQGNVTFSNPESNMTEVTVPNFGLYSFSYPGCDTTATISVGFECPLIFPNVLTPNDDENNDYFLIQNLNPEIYTESIFTIYNRWGIVIYNSREYGLNGEWWDGKTTYKNNKVTDGTYYYILEIFNNVKKQKEEYSGEINLFMSNSSSLNEE